MTKILNVTWLSGGHVFRLVVAFLVTVQTVRYLGPERYGLFSYVHSVAALLAPLAAFGLDQVAMRHFVIDPGRRNQILTASLVLRLAGALAAFGASIAIVLVLDGPENMLVSLVALAALSLLFLPFDAFGTLFRAQQEMSAVVVPQTIAIVVAAAITLFLVATSAPLLWFVSLRAIETSVAAIGLTCVYCLRYRTGTAAVNWGLLRALALEGWPILLSSFTVMLYTRIDQIILAQLTTVAIVGYYAAAVRLAELFYFVPLAIGAAWYADLTRAHSSKPDVFERECQRYFDTMMTVSYGVLAVLLVAGSLGLAPLFGMDFLPARSLFIVLAMSTPFSALAVAHGTVLTICGRPWAILLITATAALVSIIMNVLLIRLFGGTGAAWATAISYWVAGHGMLLAVPSLRHIGSIATKSLNPVGATLRLAGARY